MGEGDRAGSKNCSLNTVLRKEFAFVCVRGVDSGNAPEKTSRRFPLETRNILTVGLQATYYYTYTGSLSTFCTYLEDFQETKLMVED